MTNLNASCGTYVHNPGRQSSALPSLVHKFSASVNNVNNVDLVHTYLTNSVDQDVNIEFMDNAPTWGTVVETSRDFSYKISSTSGGPGDFLRRPVKIYQFNWNVGSGVDMVFNPHSLFFEDPRVLARIENFKNLTYDLKLKFVLNGSAFHFGELMCSYQPIPSNDEMLVKTPGDECLVNLSQMPHVYLQACEGQGAELTVPFFYPKNAVNVASKEWGRMGQMHLRTTVPLGHVNGSQEPITITVFAMAENVDLSMPTGVGIEYYNQSDEYMKPSVIATNVAKSAGYLANVPIIGKYARATEIAVSAMGKMAAVFGYSKPRNLDSTTLVRTYVGNDLANTNGQDPIPVLAFDAKKEVNVDPRSVGLPPLDEMALVPLAKRESYLRTVFWDSSQGPQTHLASFRVTPMSGRMGAASQYHLSPSAWVTAPFMYWKGSMNFRFNFIASRMHRGRVRFVWDPVVHLASSASVYNTNYSVIIDIAELKDKTIRIGWGQEMAYLPVGGLLTIPNFSDDEYNLRSNFANGVLSMYVVNELTCPSDEPTEIGVRVSTFMDDDFELMCPDSSIFEGVVIRTAPVAPSAPLEPSSPSVPANPPIAPDAGAGTTVDYTTCTAETFVPLGSNVPWPGGVSGFLQVDRDNPQRVFVKETNNSLKIAYNTTRPSLPTNIVVHLRPPTDVSETVVLEASRYDPTFGNLAIPAQTVFLDGSKYTPVSFNCPNTSFNYGILQITFPRNGAWRVGKVDMPADVGVQKLLGPATIDVGTSTSTNTTSTIGAFASADCTFDGSTYAQFLIPAAAQAIAFPDRVAIHALVSGTGGDVYVARLVYEDGTTSVDSVNTAVPNNPSSNTLPTMCFNVLNTEFTKKVKYIRIRKTSPGTLSILKIALFLPLYADQAAEEGSEISEADPGPQSLADTQMGNWCPGTEVNSIYSGEVFGSIRDLLKRYVMVSRLTGTGFNQTLSDFNINDSTVGVSLVQLHPMDYFRSAYAAYKGSYRIKAYVNRSRAATTTSNAYGANGSIRISRPSREFLRSGNSKFTSWITWCGGTHNSGTDGYAAAEVPYYSPLRFFPGRRVSDPSQINWVDELMLGRDRSYVQVTAFNSVIHSDLDILKSAGEDYSLFFFVCTPVLTIY